MSSAAPIFVPTVLCVRRSIDALMALGANRVVPGYLSILEAAAEEGRTHELRPRTTRFFDRYLRVGEAPAKKPYIVPFGRTSPGAGLLFNQNVAGSYAPGSIREVNPLRDVVEISPAGLFTLRRNHVRAVARRILPRPLPICATACFLYRDFGFSLMPSAPNLEAELQEHFGFALDGDPIASGVFADDSDEFSPDFEALSGV